MQIFATVTMAQAERTPSPQQLNVVRVQRCVAEDVDVNLTSNRILNGLSPMRMTLLLAARRKDDSEFKIWS